MIRRFVTGKHTHGPTIHGLIPPLAMVGSTVSCPSGKIGTGRPSVLVGEGRQARTLVR